jgi:hypothetical protein
MVGRGNPVRGFFRRWIKVATTEQAIQPRQRRFEFAQKA